MFFNAPSFFQQTVLFINHNILLCPLLRNYFLLFRSQIFPGDNKESQNVMDETFYYTNIVPQHPECNKGYWHKLENYCRKLTEKYTAIYVVSGPLFIAEKGANTDKMFVTYQVNLLLNDYFFSCNRFR